MVGGLAMTSPSRLLLVSNPNHGRAWPLLPPALCERRNASWHDLPVGAATQPARRHKEHALALFTGAQLRRAALRLKDAGNHSHPGSPLVSLDQIRLSLAGHQGQAGLVDRGKLAVQGATGSCSFRGRRPTQHLACSEAVGVPGPGLQKGLPVSGQAIVSMIVAEGLGSEGRAKTQLQLPALQQLGAVPVPACCVHPPRPLPTAPQPFFKERKAQLPGPGGGTRKARTCGPEAAARASLAWPRNPRPAGA